MPPYLHALSGFLFYLLGGSFFLAYIFLRNDILARVAAMFLYVGQLPLLIVAFLYGGISVYRSLKGEGSSRMLALAITLPLAFFFMMTIILRFFR